MITIAPDMVLESSNFIMGGTEAEVRRFVENFVESLRSRGSEITDISERAVSYRVTVAEALEKGFTREAVAAMAFGTAYRERERLYHSGEADYFDDELAVYEALDARLPD